MLAFVILVHLRLTGWNKVTAAAPDISKDRIKDIQNVLQTQA